MTNGQLVVLVLGIFEEYCKVKNIAVANFISILYFLMLQHYLKNLEIIT